MQHWPPMHHSPLHIFHLRVPRRNDLQWRLCKTRWEPIWDICRTRANMFPRNFCGDFEETFAMQASFSWWHCLSGGVNLTRAPIYPTSVSFGNGDGDWDMEGLPDLSNLGGVDRSCSYVLRATAVLFCYVLNTQPRLKNRGLQLLLCAELFNLWS